LIGDYISDLLSIFVALHKECTKQLLSLPLPLSDAARRNGQYLLVETLFENILTLPRPNVLPLYYGTIFIDLFKAQPNLLPPLLGTAVNALFHRLPSLDLELTERLLDWFSFHLSNFGYVWPWLSWNYVLGLADTAPQRVFVSKALALCVRLSYWERIQQVIPEEFLPLMPPQPHPAFRFSARNVESAAGDLNIQQYHALANDLLKLLHNKAPTNTIIGWLDAQVTPVLGSEARSVAR
jgi:nuclear cap-binding protein subunit 1